MSAFGTPPLVSIAGQFVVEAASAAALVSLGAAPVSLGAAPVSLGAALVSLGAALVSLGAALVSLGAAELVAGDVGAGEGLVPPSWAAPPSDPLSSPLPSETLLALLQPETRTVMNVSE